MHDIGVFFVTSSHITLLYNAHWMDGYTPQPTYTITYSTWTPTVIAEKQMNYNNEND